MRARPGRAPKGMSSDATTLPLRDPLLREPEPELAVGAGSFRSERRASGEAGEHGVEAQRRQRARDHDRRGRAGIILLCAAVLVLGAADRPSFLSAPSHVGFFPHWLAGPLGGLWPSFTRNPAVLKSLFTGRDRRDVRRVPRRAQVRPAAARPLGDRDDRRGARDLLPLAAALADRRLQLHQLRAHGDRRPPQSLHRRSPRSSRTATRASTSATGTACSVPTDRPSR